jgi:hypothetical protein
MDKIVCPHCQTSIRTQTVVVADAAPANVRTRPLQAFLHTLKPGRYPLADLEERYDDWRDSPDGTGAPEMSRRSLGFELERMGLQRYRTAEHRGLIVGGSRQFVADDETSELRPARPYEVGQ